MFLFAQAQLNACNRDFAAECWGIEPNSPCLFLTTCARKCQGFTRHPGDAHQESVWGAFRVWEHPAQDDYLRSCSIVLEIRVEHSYSFWTRDWNQGLWSNPVLRASELLRCYNLCLQHKKTSLWKPISELCRACIWTLPPAHSSIPNLYQFTYL